MSAWIGSFRAKVRPFDHFSGSSSGYIRDIPSVRCSLSHLRSVKWACDENEHHLISQTAVKKLKSASLLISITNQTDKELVHETFAFNILSIYIVQYMYYGWLDGWFNKKIKKNGQIRFILIMQFSMTFAFHFAIQ